MYSDEKAIKQTVGALSSTITMMAALVRIRDKTQKAKSGILREINKISQEAIDKAHELVKGNLDV